MSSLKLLASVSSLTALRRAVMPRDSPTRQPRHSLAIRVETVCADSPPFRAGRAAAADLAAGAAFAALRFALAALRAMSASSAWSSSPLARCSARICREGAGPASRVSEGASARWIATHRLKLLELGLGLVALLIAPCLSRCTDRSVHATLHSTAATSAPPLSESR